MQRVFDIIFSSSAILLLLPLLIPTMIILKLTGEGEVFYQQDRVGKNQKLFGLLKFATMLKNSPQLGSGDITIKNDPRVLPFGKLLRKTKINELPQLINILKGDMSVVGPRPLVLPTFKKYGENCVIISSIRPGLTGVGSIIFRDEETLLSDNKNPVTFYFENIHPIKAKLEIWYISNASIGLYFKLIFLTALVVVRPSLDVKKFLPQIDATSK